MDKLMKNIGLVVFLFLILSGIMILYSSPEKRSVDVSLSELVTAINNGEVK